MEFKKAFGVDKEKVEKGIWHPLALDCRVLVKRINDDDYEAMIRRLSKPHKRTLRNNTISDDIIDDIVNRATARHILVGWEGLTEDGQEIPYSEEKALELLKSSKDFRETILDVAKDLGVFQEEDEADSEGN